MSAPEPHVHDQVDAYLHDLLTPEQATRVARHCADCPDCQRALAQAHLRREALRSVPPSEAAPQLVKDTLDHIAGHEQRRKRRRRRTLWGAFGALAAGLAVLAGLHLYYHNLEPSPYDLVVLGQRQLLAATSATLNVRLVNRAGGHNVAGWPVVVQLRRPDGTSADLAHFTTDNHGGGTPRVELPDWPEGGYELRVQARVRGRAEAVSRTVELVRSWHVMLSSDKPVYQPGQVIKLRALTLRRPDLRPVAGHNAVFTVTDPKGNVIYKQQGKTSKFGISAAECELASLIREGAYTITCKVGPGEGRLPVEIKKYVLPKFKVDVRPDRTFYAPGDKVKCRVQADYFFGKPLAGAAVELALLPVAAEAKPLATLKGKTDDKGSASFDYTLPRAMAGEELDARLALKVTVTDSAGQKVTAGVQRPVTTRPVRIEAIPESGTLVRGVANTVYVLVTRADGTPVQDARLRLGGDARWQAAGPDERPRERELRTDDAGAASFQVTPATQECDWVIRASDAQGEFLARRHDRLECGAFPEDFLLRCDRAVYRAGDTMTLSAEGAPGRVFVDLVKDGQTFQTEVLDVGAAGGHAFGLPPDLFGTVRLVAYRFVGEGRLLRKTRVLYVRPRHELQIRATFDAKEYRPGRRATLNVRLTDDKGQPCPGALSVAAVDEAVFGVLPQPPGQERGFYTLDPELLKPVYARRSWSPGQAGGETTFVRALFAATAGGALEDLPQNAGGKRRSASTHSLAATSYSEKAVQTRRDREHGLGWVRLGWVAFLLLVLLAGYIGLWVFLPVAEVLKVHAVALVFVVPLTVLAGLAWRETRWAQGYRGLLDYSGSMHTHGGSVAPEEAGLRVTTGVDLPDADVPADDFRGARLFDTRYRETTIGTAQPRVRRLFPETLLWQPQLITDDNGRATLPIELADSITNWRLSASAVAADGRLGATQLPLKVFQPFFVDLNLPVSLRRNDEVSVPVVVYNYLDKPQTVTLKLADRKWFKLAEGRERTLELTPGEVRAAHYRLKVLTVGRHTLEVSAHAGAVGDAVRRDVEVVPDGRRQELAFSGTLERPAELTLEVPPDAIPGSVQAVVKVYPSSFSQLVEGLENIFRLPSGCFEQTSSTTYPNVLALDYLQRHKLKAGEVRKRARRFIHLGYQRLLTFEGAEGGFGWFGGGQPDLVLTAYGLMEFEDMARVHSVDPGLLERTRAWLLRQRKADGSWGDAAPPNPARLGTTAYVAWAVFAGGKAPQQASATLDFLLAHPPARIKDPYELALVCNALLALEPTGREAGPYLDRLAALKQTDKGGQFAFWEQPHGARTAFYSAGQGGQVETTALAALALLGSNRYPGVARPALAWLVSQKDPAGTWHSTQATVLSLKALLAGTRKALGGDRERRIAVRLGGKLVRELVIPADQTEVLKQVDLSGHVGAGKQALRLTETSKTAAGYQVSLRYHVPDKKAQDDGPLTIALAYPRTDLRVGEAVTVKARVRNRAKTAAPMLMLELPVPAGLAPEAGDFTRLVSAGTIARFELTPRGVRVYLRRLSPGKPLELAYRLRATLEGEVTAPGARVYEYYDPQKQGRSAGVRFVVRPGAAARPL
jgi:hypothetical protein